MLTFQAALEQAGHIPGITNKILLLGNGFSCACALANTQIDDNTFNYSKLLEVIEHQLPNGKSVQELSDLIGTTNFESMLSSLIKTTEILRFMVGSNNSVLSDEQVNQYYREIQNHLISAISQVHPYQCHVIEDNSYKSCALFLNNFSSIYTLNYDLLLYWAIRSDLNELRNSCNDGYWMKPSKDDNCHVYWDFQFKGTTFYFLHGAIHLYNDKDDNQYKLTNANVNNSLILSVVQQIKNRNYPLIVIEGKHENKLLQIKENPYLNFCFNSLKRDSGVLFIFGVSFEFDQHIINAISHNKHIKRIYVGIHNEDHSPTARLGITGKEIVEYDANFFNPWEALIV